MLPEVLTRAVVVATELPLQLPLELSSRAMIEVRPGQSSALGPCSPWHAAHLAIGSYLMSVHILLSGRLPRGINSTVQRLSLFGQQHAC